MLIIFKNRSIADFAVEIFDLENIKHKQILA